MDAGTVLAMLQVSIALGILYWALRAARYRERLFLSIAASFKGQAVRDSTDNGLYESMPARSKLFADNYHRVMMWRDELPERFDSQLEGTSADRFPRRRGSNPNDRSKLPLRYRWFRADGDKYVAFAVATILPVLAMWVMALFMEPGLLTGSAAWLNSPPMLSHGVSHSIMVGAYVVAFVGQVCVAIHVVLGSHMVKRHGDEFSKALGEVIAMVEEASASKDVADLPASSMWTSRR